MTSVLLSPAEAALLIDPRAASASACLELALLDLIARGHLRIQPGRRWLADHQLHLEQPVAEAPPGHLAAVLDTLRAGGRASVLGRHEVLSALQTRFGLGYARYVQDCLAPMLIGRGLLVEERRKLLGLFPYRRYRRTAAGEERVQALQQLVAALNRMPKLVASDPDAALRLARSAGVLLALSPVARKQSSKLKALLQDRDGDAHIPAGTGDAGFGHGVDTGGTAVFGDVGTLFDSVGAVGDFTGGDGSASDGGDGGGGGGD